MELQERLWAASIDEVARCTAVSGRGYVCLVCGEEFESGVIYPVEERLVDAARAVQEHVRMAHEGALAFLLSLDRKYTGLSKSQLDILRCLAEDLDDKASATRLGIAPATVRNHRFRLREKAKQARIFLAVMENINLREKEPDLVKAHPTATAVDERYATTQKEREKTLKNHIDQAGRLRNFPSKEKRKLVILAHLATRFTVGRDYTESEVNEVIAAFADDFATLRRYLIQYGFLEREQDCSAYRVKQ